MDKITPTREERFKALEENTIASRSTKKKLKKSFISSMGLVFGVFIMFATVVVATTDIKLTDFKDIASLGLNFFLLLLCTYMMYVSCSDSGMKAGLDTDLYKNSIIAFESNKRAIIEGNLQIKLAQFCYHYITEELKMTRLLTLAVVGFSYDDYTEKYLKLSKDEILNDNSLTKTQQKAIIKANAYEPIKLTPEMILRRGRSSRSRSPLGMTPEDKKKIGFGKKFLTSLVVSLFLSTIVLDASAKSTWLIIAEVILKLLAVAMNGFTGYKFGYENIVFDTVDYMNDQTDLMTQAKDYIASL